MMTRMDLVDRLFDGNLILTKKEAKEVAMLFDDVIINAATKRLTIKSLNVEFVWED